MNIGKIAKGILKSVAPMVATAIGGPVAPMALNVLKGVLGTDDESLIEQQIAEASPETLAKLREADQMFRARMRELDIQEQDLYLQDTQDARGTAVKFGTFMPQLLLTFVAIVGFSGLLYALVVKAVVIPEESRTIVMLLVGQLSTFVGMGYAFFLGSSKGSKEKFSDPRIYK